MKRAAMFILSLMVLALLAPAGAHAGEPYTIHWLITEENPACEPADLTAHDGEPFFSVNTTPLPTYQVPGALTMNADGTETNTAEAGFDSLLLAPGSNAFHFQVANDMGADYCVHQPIVGATGRRSAATRRWA
jgi:hypothetical protein